MFGLAKSSTSEKQEDQNGVKNNSIIQASGHVPWGKPSSLKSMSAPFRARLFLDGVPAPYWRCAPQGWRSDAHDSSFPPRLALILGTPVWKPPLPPYPARGNHKVQLICPELTHFRQAQVIAKRRIRFLCYHLLIQYFWVYRVCGSVSGKQHSMKCEFCTTLRWSGRRRRQLFLTSSHHRPPSS